MTYVVLAYQCKIKLEVINTQIVDMYCQVIFTIVRLFACHDWDEQNQHVVSFDFVN